MPDGISLSELARRLNRAKSGLHKLAGLKQIPRLADGSFDQAAVEIALTKLDPARRKPLLKNVHPRTVNDELVNGEQSLRPPIWECLDAYEADDDRGAVAMALLLARGVGAMAASMALDAGAPIKVAHTLQTMTTVAFTFAVEDACRAMGIDPEPITYRVDAFDKVNWDTVAAQTGERFEPEVWEAWTRERIALANAAAQL